MWRRIWLLPAIYFIAIVTSGAPFNPVSFHGTDFILHRLLNYCTMLLICFVFLNGIKAEAATRKEQAAEAEKDTLERLRRTEASLIANIAHETKTPLAVLSGYAELIAGELREKDVDEQTARDLDNIAEEAQRISWLMDELNRHTLAKDASLAKTRLCLAGIIEGAARLYTPILERGKNTLAVRLPDGLPDVYACAGEVTQVLFNLLQNARNHTDNGEVILSAAAEGESVAVTVSDTGTGIPPALLPHVFERGVSGDKGGSGLGLAICKEIITGHGGEITAANGERGGAAVRFTLPVWKEGKHDGQENGTAGGGQ